MNLTQIEYFVKVAQLGSMSAVAKESYVSHPAISKAINMFEEEIGVTLFYRVPSGCILTDSGETVYNFALEMLKNKDNILNSGSLMDPLGNGSVKLISTQTQLLVNIKQEMISIKRQFPNTHFSVTTALTEDIEACLKLGEANMGLFLTYDEQIPLLEKDFHIYPLCDCSVCIACDEKNKLAVQKSVQGDMLASYHVVSGNDEYLTRFIEEYITDNYDILYDTDSALMRLGSVANTDYICFTTNIEFGCYKHLNDNIKLKALPLNADGMPVKMSYIAACSKKYPVSPLVNFFISSLKDSFRRMEENEKRL